MLTEILIYLAAFFFIWYGSGLIIAAANNFSRKLNISPYLFSFLFLGVLTSIPEFSIGLQAIASDKSEIFVGNLLGGIIVLFLVVIPLLAVIGNGINVKHELKGFSLIVTLGVILAPAVTILDKVVTNVEGGILVLLYVTLMIFIQRNKGLLDKKNRKLLNIKAYSYRDLLSLFAGLGIVFISSRILIEKTIFFANIFNVSAFYISLIVIALGTDLPELTLAVRSAMQKKKDVAMGDYVGAAAASTLLFGVFTLLHNGEVVSGHNFLITFAFIFLALVLFYVFSRSKQYISRKEGVILLAVYTSFLFFEMMSK